MGRHSSRDEAIGIIMDKLSKILTEEKDIEAILDDIGIFNLKKKREEIKLHLKNLEYLVWDISGQCYLLKNSKLSNIMPGMSAQINFMKEKNKENQNKFKEVLSKSVKEDNDVLKELANSNKT
ncbi:MAG: hypothetical protein QW046_04250 [Candidatus Micrarchaeaceae archaeon]